jgi:hypothetical protein
MGFPLHFGVRLIWWGGSSCFLNMDGPFSGLLRRLSGISHLEGSRWKVGSSPPTSLPLLHPTLARDSLSHSLVIVVKTCGRKQRIISSSIVVWWIQGDQRRKGADKHLLRELTNHPETWLKVSWVFSANSCFSSGLKYECPTK